MNESTTRSRQNLSRKPTDSTSDQERDKMLIKNRKNSTENYEFTDIQRVPTNLRDLMDKNIFRLFTWEVYFGENSVFK